MRIHRAASAAARVGVWVLCEQLMDFFDNPLESVPGAAVVLPVSGGWPIDFAAVTPPAPKYMHGEVVVVTEILVQHGWAIIRATIADVRIFQIDVDNVSHCLPSHGRPQLPAKLLQCALATMA
jgi:hypothetical protein